MSVLRAALSNVILAVLLACALLSFALPAEAQLGRTVRNVATVTVDNYGVPLTFDTNEASFIIEARRTQSSIEFFRYAPIAPDAFTTRINGSDYSPGGTMPPLGMAAGAPGDPFIPVGPPVTSGGRVLDLSGDVPLTPASHYLSGELMIVRVIDAGQNGDPSAIETIVITILTDNGDEIILRLYESGPDTGEFYGYVPSSRDSTAMNDNTLTAPAGSVLTARYVDSFDATEVSVDTAVIDPQSRVFDSLTGELLSNVRVTIIDVATGLPAQVYGVDGASSYPSSVYTGGVVTDASGLQYPLQDGEFLFPVLTPGEYRLEVDAPEGYIYSSGVAEENFTTLANAPFDIIQGSYGQSFTVIQTGPLNFDVPLDPAGELVLTKEAASATASIGDHVGYTVTIENRDVVSAPIRVRDTLPRGLRYLKGSARLNGQAIAEPAIAENGRDLVFTGSLLAPGEQAHLTYVAAVSAGAEPGDAVNAAVAVNAAGAEISNRAEAAVEIVEDLFRTRLTIIGRVAEKACDADEDWSRELVDGEGVAGVRLYMETGEYVVTDADGLFHFEGVKPAAHVVQLDEETLPAGYEPMVCEENSRYAGSAISKFVDAGGGTIWRANFYLKRTAEAATEEARVQFDDTTEYLEYDNDWLDTQSDDIRWAYPVTTRTPSSRSVNIGIVHSQRQTVQLSLNGRPVPGLNFSGRDTSDTGPAAISRWRGVDIIDGENVFVARVLDAQGQQVAKLQESIWYVSHISRARLVADQTVAVADGRTPPVIAVRLEDASGHPVHAGRILQVEVSEPYQLLADAQFESEAPIVALTTETGIAVGPDGIAEIQLQPTLQAGRVRLKVSLDNGRTEDVIAQLTPEKRDWILVGIADGQLELDDLEGARGNGSDTLSDGRIAFFAKGMIKGDWLLTLAVDTARRRGNRDEDLFEGRIDPNAYYTLYGDRTFQYGEADSRYPVYVKLEKEAVSLMFGDFNTDLNDSELGKYSRRLSGLKATYMGRNVSATGFAAETNQGFVKDEIAADGTSGPYRLSGAPLIRNSETITVETRDRTRPDRILATRQYTRYLDYEIDYATGEVIFRHPVNVSDAGFNPNVIVADYEVSGDVERNVTSGGRVALHTEGREREIGVSYIREEGDANTADASSDLLSVDAVARLNETTELRAEAATSSRETETGTERADAYLIEAVRQSETLTVSAYVREEGEGFGLGQQASNTGGIRRLGADVSARLFEKVSEDTGQRTERYLDAQAYSEESLSQNATRKVADIALRQENDAFGASIGLKSVSESYDDEDRQSLLLTGSVRKNFQEHGLTLTASHEQPLARSGSNDEASLFPQRTQLGLDKRLTDWATLNFRHEINNGADASGDNTVAGLTVKPWSGGEVRLAGDRITQDGTPRLGATVGVDQTYQINERWSASAGASHRARIDEGDNPRDVTPDAAVSPFEDGVRSPLVQNQNYTALYGGLGYRSEKAAGSGRMEYRNSETGKRYAVILGGARESSETFSYAAAARLQQESGSGFAEQKSAEARIGSAWRPRGEGAVVFNRLDVKYNETVGEQKSQKLVNNLGINWMLNERSQAAVYWGIKYAENETAGVATSGVTNLIGGELRTDITRKVDIGLTGSVLFDDATNTANYAYGPSIGLTPAKNVWVSLGYNVAGFTDQDFEAAEYSREGAYIKIRVKFDQHTAHGLLKRISPKRD